MNQKDALKMIKKCLSEKKAEKIEIIDVKSVLLLRIFISSVVRTIPGKLMP